jgi:hypothetical protein
VAVPGLEYVPCGECRALIFADTGCKHWKGPSAPPAGKRLGWKRGRSRWSVSVHEERELERLALEVLERGGLTDR